jgi:hypothetical protein
MVESTTHRNECGMRLQLARPSVSKPVFMAGQRSRSMNMSRSPAAESVSGTDQSIERAASIGVGAVRRDCPRSRSTAFARRVIAVDRGSTSEVSTLGLRPGQLRRVILTRQRSFPSDTRVVVDAVLRCLHWECWFPNLQSSPGAATDHENGRGERPHPRPFSCRNGRRES